MGERGSLNERKIEKTEWRRANLMGTVREEENT